MTIRPLCVDDVHLEYLDRLRESGKTNMYGAAPFLASKFGLPKRIARQILSYWMDSFDERHPEEIS